MEQVAQAILDVLIRIGAAVSQSAYANVGFPALKFFYDSLGFFWVCVLGLGLGGFFLMLGWRLARLATDSKAVQLSALRFFGVVAVFASGIAIVSVLLPFGTLGARDFFYGSSPGAEFIWADFQAGLIAGAAGITSGFVLWLWVASSVEPALAKRYAVAKSADALSDVREIVQERFPRVSFSALKKSVAKSGAVALGVQANGKAAAIPFETFLKTSFQILGAQGSGKGVVAQGIFDQVLGRVKGVVFDPKNDEFLTSQFAGLGAAFVDLRADVPQIDLFSGASASEVVSTLVDAFGVRERGQLSDFYAVKEQVALHKLASQVNSWDFRELSAVASTLEELKKSGERLSFLATFKPFAGSLSLEEVLAKYPALYVVFDEANEFQKLAAKLIFVRLVSLKKKGAIRDHLTVLADEFFHLVTRATVSAPPLMRSHGMNFLIAHQSVGDFKDSFSDIDSEAALERVLDSTQVKIVFKRQRDAEFWAKMTGKKVFDDLQGVAASNEAQGDVVSGESRVVARQRELIDENEFLTLGDGVAVVIGLGVARKIKTVPPVVEKRSFEIVKSAAAPGGLAARSGSEAKASQPSRAPEVEIGGFDL